MALHTLIIDDDPIIVMLMKKMLEKSDFHAVPKSFNNGLEALNHLKDSYADNDKYVVLLDINMPVMNGWDFLEGLKEFADESNTFVFVISSSINQEDELKANDNKFVVRYLSKPVYTDTLASLKHMLELKTNIKLEDLDKL